MRSRVLGQTGMRVSVLGFGGAEIGYRGGTRESVGKLLGSALDAGLNVIDTAECYLTSEELIGQTVSHRRKDYYLFTKCGHSRGYEDPDWHDTGRLQSSLERSLKLLQTDHLDLFQLHSCTKEVLEQGVVIDLMRRAKESGKTRFIGYSGEEDAALYAVRSGAFDTLQISVSIADQHCLEEILPEATTRQMGIIAKRPVANVIWVEKNDPGDYYREYWKRFKELQYDFLQGEVSEAVATALRFTLSVPGISVAIVGTQKPGRWQENAQIVAQGPLPPAQFDAIRRRWKAVASPGWLGQV